MKILEVIRLFNWEDLCLKQVFVMTFGKFIEEQRKKNGLFYRDIAQALEVSAVYVSDIEKGRKNSFRKDKLEILAELFNLSDEEKNTMFDLAGKQRNIVSPDLLDYIMERQYVRAVLRTARDLDASEADWNMTTAIFKRGKGNDASL